LLNDDKTDGQTHVHCHVDVLADVVIIM